MMVSMLRVIWRMERPSITPKSLKKCLLIVNSPPFYQRLRGRFPRASAAFPHTPPSRAETAFFNRNLRYFYPKGTRFEHISAQNLTTTLLQINQRPLKILDWQTPYQVMLTNLSKNSD